MDLGIPQEMNFFREGFCYACGKRPQVVKGNGVIIEVLLARLDIVNRGIFKLKLMIEGGKIMEHAISVSSLFWLFGPMSLLIILSFITMITERSRGD